MVPTAIWRFCAYKFRALKMFFNIIMQIAKFIYGVHLTNPPYVTILLVVNVFCRFPDCSRRAAFSCSDTGMLSVLANAAPNDSCIDAANLTGYAMYAVDSRATDCHGHADDNEIEQDINQRLHVFHFLPAQCGESAFRARSLPFASTHSHYRGSCVRSRSRSTPFCDSAAF
jgi:hypothetical protein